MANKEKVEIVRSDQFQEVDDELTRAMAELDSTIERVSLIFQANADAPESEGGPETAAPEEPDAEVESGEPSLSGKPAGRSKSEQ